jgi:hypothetical protein
MSIPMPADDHPATRAARTGLLDELSELEI